ncbi:MAG: hypothetical protein GPOALKHO_000273 [Sodalis sp.]|nr:MAG: hypothetical protein GPOALKHO_000273 [Sodalis sp.]
MGAVGDIMGAVGDIRNLQSPRLQQLSNRVDLWLA